MTPPVLVDQYKAHQTEADLAMQKQVIGFYKLARGFSRAISYAGKFSEIDGALGYGEKMHELVAVKSRKSVFEEDQLGTILPFETKVREDYTIDCKSINNLRRLAHEHHTNAILLVRFSSGHLIRFDVSRAGYMATIKTWTMKRHDRDELPDLQFLFPFRDAELIGRMK